MEAFVPLYSIFNLPFLFNSNEHLLRALAGDVGAEVLQACAETGMVGLGMLHEGCRSFYTTQPAPPCSR